MDEAVGRGAALAQEPPASSMHTWRDLNQYHVPVNTGTDPAAPRYTNSGTQFGDPQSVCSNLEARFHGTGTGRGVKPPSVHDRHRPARPMVTTC